MRVKREPVMTSAPPPPQYEGVPGNTSAPPIEPDDYQVYITHPDGSPPPSDAETQDPAHKANPADKFNTEDKAAVKDDDDDDEIRATDTVDGEDKEAHTENVDGRRPADDIDSEDTVALTDNYDGLRPADNTGGENKVTITEDGGGRRPTGEDEGEAYVALTKSDDGPGSAGVMDENKVAPIEDGEGITSAYAVESGERLAVTEGDKVDDEDKVNHIEKADGSRPAEVDDVEDKIVTLTEDESGTKPADNIVNEGLVVTEDCDGTKPTDKIADGDEMAPTENDGGARPAETEERDKIAEAEAEAEDNVKARPTGLGDEGETMALTEDVDQCKMEEEPQDAVAVIQEEGDQVLDNTQYVIIEEGQMEGGEGELEENSEGTQTIYVVAEGLDSEEVVRLVQQEQISALVQDEVTEESSPKVDDIVVEAQAQGVVEEEEQIVQEQVEEIMEEQPPGGTEEKPKEIMEVQSQALIDEQEREAVEEQAQEEVLEDHTQMEVVEEQTNEEVAKHTHSLAIDAYSPISNDDPMDASDVVEVEVPYVNSPAMEKTCSGVTLGAVSRTSTPTDFLPETSIIAQLPSKGVKNVVVEKIQYEMPVIKREILDSATNKDVFCPVLPDALTEEGAASKNADADNDKPKVKKKRRRKKKDKLLLSSENQLPQTQVPFPFPFVPPGIPNWLPNCEKVAEQNISQALPSQDQPNPGPVIKKKRRRRRKVDANGIPIPKARDHCAPYNEAANHVNPQRLAHVMAVQAQYPLLCKLLKPQHPVVALPTAPTEEPQAPATENQAEPPPVLPPVATLAQSAPAQMPEAALPPTKPPTEPELKSAPQPKATVPAPPVSENPPVPAAPTVPPVVAQPPPMLWPPFPPVQPTPGQENTAQGVPQLPFPMAPLPPFPMPTSKDFPAFPLPPAGQFPMPFTPEFFELCKKIGEAWGYQMPTFQPPVKKRKKKRRKRLRDQQAVQGVGEAPDMSAGNGTEPSANVPTEGLETRLKEHGLPPPHAPLAQPSKPALEHPLNVLPPPEPVKEVEKTQELLPPGLADGVPTSVPHTEPVATVSPRLPITNDQVRANVPDHGQPLTSLSAAIMPPVNQPLVSPPTQQPRTEDGPQDLRIDEKKAQSPTKKKRRRKRKLKDGVPPMQPFNFPMQMLPPLPFPPAQFPLGLPPAGTTGQPLPLMSPESKDQPPSTAVLPSTSSAHPPVSAGVPAVLSPNQIPGPPPTKAPSPPLLPPVSHGAPVTMSTLPAALHMLQTSTPSALPFSPQGPPHIQTSEPSEKSLQPQNVMPYSSAPEVMDKPSARSQPKALKKVLKSKRVLTSQMTLQQLVNATISDELESDLQSSPPEVTPPSIAQRMVAPLPSLTSPSTTASQVQAASGQKIREETHQSLRNLLSKRALHSPSQLDLGLAKPPPPVIEPPAIDPQSETNTAVQGLLALNQSQPPAMDFPAPSGPVSALPSISSILPSVSSGITQAMDPPRSQPPPPPPPPPVQPDISPRAPIPVDFPLTHAQQPPDALHVLPPAPAPAPPPPPGPQVPSSPQNTVLNQLTDQYIHNWRPTGQYCCCLCSYSCVTKNYLFRHWLVHHNQTLYAYRCAYCAFHATYKDGVTRHVGRWHKDKPKEVVVDFEVEDEAVRQFKAIFGLDIQRDRLSTGSVSEEHLEGLPQVSLGPQDLSPASSAVPLVSQTTPPVFTPESAMIPSSTAAPHTQPSVPPKKRRKSRMLAYNAPPVMSSTDVPPMSYGSLSDAQLLQQAGSYVQRQQHVPPVPQVPLLPQAADNQPAAAPQHQPPLLPLASGITTPAPIPTATLQPPAKTSPQKTTQPAGAPPLLPPPFPSTLSGKEPSAATQVTPPSVPSQVPPVEHLPPATVSRQLQDPSKPQPAPVPLYPVPAPKDPSQVPPRRMPQVPKSAPAVSPAEEQTSPLKAYLLSRLHVAPGESLPKYEDVIRGSEAAAQGLASPQPAPGTSIPRYPGPPEQLRPMAPPPPITEAAARVGEARRHTDPGHGDGALRFLEAQRGLAEEHHVKSTESTPDQHTPVNYTYIPKELALTNPGNKQGDVGEGMHVSSFSAIANNCGTIQTVTAHNTKPQEISASYSSAQAALHPVTETVDVNCNKADVDNRIIDTAHITPEAKQESSTLRAETSGDVPSPTTPGKVGDVIQSKTLQVSDKTGASSDSLSGHQDGAVSQAGEEKFPVSATSEDMSQKGDTLPGEML